MESLTMNAMLASAALLLCGGFFVTYMRAARGRKSQAIQGGGLVVLGFMSFVAAYYSHSQSAGADPWEMFVQAHHCRVVEKRQGHDNAGLGLTTSGKMGVLLGQDTPDQTAYRCDDNIIYWRND